MIGEKTIEFDWRNFVQGMSTSDSALDGGFSSKTTGVNLTKTPGEAYGFASGTDKASVLTGNVIASAEDPTYQGNNRMFLDDSGHFYTLSSGTLTDKATATGSFGGTGTDFVAWNGAWYATTQAGINPDVVEWDGATTVVSDWWSSELGGSGLSQVTPFRPLLVYETHLFLGDKNKLHRIDTSETVSEGIVTLHQDDRITALGFDKGTGYMLIGVINVGRAAGGKRGFSRILLYNGTSNKVVKEVPVSGQVYAFITGDDRTYVSYENRLGYFTGSGIKFLRQTIPQLQKHDFVFYKNTLYYHDDDFVIAYGEIMNGAGKVFYPVVENDEGITFLSHAIDDTLALHGTDGDPVFYLFDLSSSGTNGDFYTHPFRFPRPVHFRELYVEYTGDVADSATPLTVSLIDDDNTTNTLPSLANNTGGTIRNATISLGDIKTRSGQLKITFGVSTIGIKRIIMSYDFAE